MTSFETLASDLLLLMLTVEQVTDRDRVVTVFEQSLCEALAPLTFEFVRQAPQGPPTQCFEVSTHKQTFGWLLAKGGEPPEPIAGLLSNAARMLALVLENRAQSELLAQDRHRLERAVAQRTAELARSRERARLLFEANAAGMIVQDTTGRIVEANAEACRILALLHDHVVGSYSTDERWRAVFEDGSPAPGERHPGMVALRTGEPLRNIVMGIYHGDSAFRWLLISSEPLRDEPGGPVREVVTTFLDITALKQAEENRRIAEAGMLQAQKWESLGVLAGGIAHDFNNLLTGVLANASLALLEPGLTSAARLALEQMEQSARRASELTAQLLEYSGKSPAEVRALDVSCLVSQTTDLLRLAASKKCALAFDLAPHGAMAESDPAQLRQVLMSLVMNASEAVGDSDGAVAITVKTVRCSRERLRAANVPSNAEPGDFVMLQVSDTGVGMSPDTLKRVFDPFFSTKFVGRGLGLASVMGIVQRCRGAIEIDSLPGRGTMVRVLLPASPAVVVAPPPTPRCAPRARTTTRVLVVDDEPAIRNVAKRVLVRAGFEVTLANDGREALDVLRDSANLPDLIVLDATMPRMGGMETVRALRALGFTVPVLLASGYAHPDPGDGDPSEHVDGFLAKPFTGQQLLTAIAGVLDKQS